jgi:acetylornithine/N-succinyldiaminopimelate aminotransferase
MRERLLAMDGVSSVSGLGLMIGVSLTDKKAADIVKACAKAGLLILTAKDKLRLLPPLIIGKEDIDAGLDILEKVLQDEMR